MNEKVTIREVRKLQSSSNLYNGIGVLGYVMGFVSIIVLIFKGLPGLVMFGVSALLLTLGLTAKSSFQRKADAYAGLALLLPRWQQRCQMYETKPAEGMPKYMAERSEIIEFGNTYRGYGYIRATYRGAMFTASHLRITYKPQRNEDEDMNHDARIRNCKSRHKRHCLRANVKFSGIFARVDLNLKAEGFLKIEEKPSRRNLGEKIMAPLVEVAEKRSGIQTYNFSAVNPEFHKKFKVSASDQWLAGQVLSETLMREFLKIAEDAPGMIKLHIKEDDLFYSCDTYNYYFGLQEEKYCKEFYDEDCRRADREINTFTSVMDFFVENTPFLFFQ